MIAAFFPFILPFLTGYLFWRWLTLKTDLPNKSLFSFSVAIPTGLAFFSVNIFLFHLLVPGHSHVATRWSSWLMPLFFLLLNLLPASLHHSLYGPHTNYPKGAYPSKKVIFHLLLTFTTFILFSMALYSYLIYFRNYVTWNLFGGWDGRYFWDLKARFLSRNPLEWKALFDPIMANWTLPDYPLLLPGSVAWGWISIGREFLAWPPLVGLSFYLSLLVHCIWYLKSMRSSATAFLGAAFLVCLPAFSFWSTTHYADIPFSFFLTSSCLLIIFSLRTQSSRLFLASGLMAGLSCWTKNEGIPVVPGLLLLLLFYAWNNKNRNLAFRNIAMFLLGIFPLLVVIGILKFGLGGGGVYLDSTRSSAELLRQILDPMRYAYIAKAFYIYKTNSASWLYLWPLFTLAVFSFVFRMRIFPHGHYRWIPLMAVLWVELAYFSVYVITPIDLAFHIQTSMTRLLLHTAPLALVFLFDIFGIDDPTGNSFPAFIAPPATEGAELITILMPSFQSARFIRESIDSVLSQNDPNLELIVLDGGSTDETVSILESYGDKIRWISEADKGQADALNKGMSLAKGSLLGWLNSDDLYCPGALAHVRARFTSNHATQWLFGPCRIINEDGHEIRKFVSWYKTFRLSRYTYTQHLTENFVSQMGVFARTEFLRNSGLFDIDLNWALDYDLWLRMGLRSIPAYIPYDLGMFRMYSDSKTVSGFEKGFREDLRVAQKYSAGNPLPLWLHHFHNQKIVFIYNLLSR